MTGWDFLLGSPSKTETSFVQSPEQKDYYNQLMSLVYSGFPEFGQQANQQWQDVIMPSIQETYRGRRNLGMGSTPEVSQLGRAGAGLTSDLASKQAMARLQAMGMIPQSFPTPITSVSEPTTGLLQNLLSFAAPIAGGFFQSQALSPLFKSLMGGGGQGGGLFDLSSILPSSSIEDFLYSPTDYGRARPNLNWGY